MLIDGTFARVRESREGLLARWLLTLPVYQAREDCPDLRGGLHEWERVRRCIEQSIAIEIQCRCCDDQVVHLQGSCKRRDCLLCCDRYPREKAREYRELLGHVDWLGHYVATLPADLSAHVTPKEATPILRAVCEAICYLFDPVEPGGLACLHWSGDSDPRKPHVHVHVLWASHGLHDGAPVSMPGPTLSRPLVRELRELTGLALGAPDGQRNGHYSFREEEPQVRHCLAYALRSQGCGSDVARSIYTIPYGRTLAPLGGLAKHRRKDWEAIFPPYVEKSNSHVRPDVERFCKCGNTGHSFVDRSPFASEER